MILYIHGFASCGDSNKTKLLKKHFGEVLSPDIPVNPHEAIVFLKELISAHPVSLLIGSSLGGFYASYLAEKFHIKTVLINPSTKPYQTLAPYVGMNEFFCSGERFEWKEDYLHDLQAYETAKDSIDVDILVLLQKEDEVLDYKKAASLYENYKIIIQEGGNHRFENLDEYLEVISKFKEGLLNISQVKL